MRRILKKGQRFYREDLPVSDAFARLDEMQEPYKREYAAELVDLNGLESLSFYRNGPFLDMCEGPHVDTTKRHPARCLQAAQRRRRLLARGCRERDDDTHLRVGLRRQGKPRCSSECLQTRPGTRPQETRPGTRPVPDRRRYRSRPAAVAAERHGDPRRTGEAGRRTGVQGGLRARRHAAHRQGRPVRPHRPLGALQGQHVPAHGGDRGVSRRRVRSRDLHASAHELPAPSQDLRIEAAQLSRPARSGSPSTATCTAGRPPARCRDSPACAACP